MNRMFSLLAVLCVVPLMLAACQTTKIDDAIAKNLPAACSTLDKVHASFVIIASTGKVKPSVVAKEDAAYAGVASICADPSAFTTSTALVKVAEAYAAVVNALRTAGD